MMKKESVDAARDGARGSAATGANPNSTSSDVERMREALERLLAVFDKHPVVLDDEEYDAIEQAHAALLSLSRERDGCLSGRDAPSDEHSTWVLVPREPTDAMVRAAGGALKAYIYGLSHEERSKLKPRKTGKSDNAGYSIRPQIKARVRWQAMIAVAGTPDQPHSVHAIKAVLAATREGRPLSWQERRLILDGLKGQETVSDERDGTTASARSEHKCTNGNECLLSNAECQWPDCRKKGEE